jgi:hypothetical protein
VSEAIKGCWAQLDSMLRSCQEQAGTHQQHAQSVSADNFAICTDNSNLHRQQQRSLRGMGAELGCTHVQGEV